MKSTGRSEQLAASPVDDRNIVVLGDQHDALVHVFERELELFRFCLAPVSLRRILSMAARMIMVKSTPVSEFHFRLSSDGCRTSSLRTPTLSHSG